MKCVRFLVHGHYHEGTLTATGMLRDEAGHEHRGDDVVFLPPVEPHAIIGLALNYADHVTELSKVDLPSEQANTIKQQPALFFKPLTSLTEEERMFRDAGFARTEIRTPGRSGFLVRAHRE